MFAFISAQAGRKTDRRALIVLIKFAFKTRGKHTHTLRFTSRQSKNVIDLVYDLSSGGGSCSDDSSQSKDYYYYFNYHQHQCDAMLDYVC